MIHLSAYTAHVNNWFGVQNVGGVMDMSGVQYSGSYGENLFDTRSTYSPLVDNDMAVSLAVAHTAL